MKKTRIICDFDLDGAGCCLVTKWSSSNREYEFVGTNEDGLENELKNADPTAPLLIYDVLFEQKHVDLADRSNVLFVHHHDPITTITSKKCKIIYRSETSCTKLLQQIFKNVNLTMEQKNILNYIDDYDCYDLKYKKSLFLNMLFWSFTGNKIEKFVSAFEHGDREFTDQEKNMIRLYVNKMIETAKNSEPHIYKTKKFNIIIFYADFAINELCAEFTKKYDCDAAIAIKKNTLSAWIRINRAKNTEFDCGIFSKMYLGGHGFKNFGSGKITEAFVDLSKNFDKI